MAKQGPSFSFHKSPFVAKLLECLQLKRYSDIFTKKISMIVAKPLADGTHSCLRCGKIKNIHRLSVSGTKEEYKVEIDVRNDTVRMLLLEYDPQANTIKISEKDNAPHGAHYTIFTKKTKKTPLMGYSGEVIA